MKSSSHAEQIWLPPSLPIRSPGPPELFSAPGDDTARASCGNSFKRKYLSLNEGFLPIGWPQAMLQA